MGMGIRMRRKLSAMLMSRDSSFGFPSCEMGDTLSAP